MDPMWRIEMFGILQARSLHTGVTISQFRSRQAASLLAILALNRAREFPREDLIEYLWPDCEPKAGRNRFSVALSSLRTQFETNSTAIFEAKRESVQMHRNAATTDVEQFEAAFTAMQSEKTGDVIASATQALELYRAPFLTNFYDDWVSRTSRRLEEQYFEMARGVIAYWNDHDNDAEALRIAERAMSFDATREDIARDALQIYLNTRRFDAARQLANSLKRALRRQYDSEPEAATLALMQQIEKSSRIVVPTAPTVLVANLPKPRTAFFGRKQELHFIAEWLADEHSPLLNITGTGGSGKTRLLIEAMNALTQEEGKRFSGGIFFVSMAAIHDATAWPAELRRALHLELAPGYDDLAQCCEKLRQQPALLLLDNFEQLVTAGLEALQTLLQQTPLLKVLVSSRRRLGLEVEAEYHLMPLAVTQGRGNAALQLFTDRAQQVRSDFTLDASNRASVASIVQRLDGIPLAIELAAARCNVLAPHEIQHLLEQSQHRLLASQGLDAPERHRTLDDAIAWSYRLLPPSLQNFWFRLSIFRGGWTLEASQALTNETNTLDALSSLQESSLVAVYSDDRGNTRFGLLETLRQWALQEMPAAVREEAAQAHATYFTKWAEELNARYRGAQQVTILDLIEVESENWRLAFDWSLQHKPKMALRLGVALGHFWRTRGYFAEGRTRLEAALQRQQKSRSSTDTRLQAQAWLAKANIEYQSGNYVAARPSGEQSLSLFEQLQDESGIATAAGLLGWVQFQTGDFANGKVLMQRALEIFQRRAAAGHEEQPGFAELLFALAVAGSWKDEAATKLVETQLPLFRARHDTQGMVVLLNALGTTAFFSNRPQEARIYIEESLQLSQLLGQVWDVTLGLWILGNIARDDNNLESARGYYERSLHTLKRAGKWPVPLLLQSFAYLAIAQGEWEHATLLLSASLALWPPTMRVSQPLAEERNVYHEKLRAALPEREFNILWCRGEQLGFEKAVALALKE